MRVFHGSDVRIDKVELAQSGAFKDFGRGFYVTTIRKHAHQRAVDVAAEHGTKPVITEFEYLERYPVTMNMHVKHFEVVSEEWVQFVIMNRNRSIAHPAHTYDIVEGPIANDWITSQIKRYQKGKITIGQLIEKLTYREQTHQICFCTPESLWALELVEDDARFDVEDISNAIIEALTIDGKMDMLAAVRRFYASATYAQLANPDTGLHVRTWEDVYALLKQEFEQHSTENS
ncbi:MAG: DUF3990 domain-containing protein [Prevotellaceae bacterium]|jgi:hypothetical protein|nr:DUF3990 domain-containing protein [Prevotellaceae bacterium]